MERFRVAVAVAALLPLLVGCGTLTVGPQVSPTSSISGYTDSFDQASPGAAMYSTPPVAVGFNGTFGFWSIKDEAEPSEVAMFGVSYFEADHRFTATAANADGVELETIEMKTSERGVEALVGLGRRAGPLGGLVVMRQRTIAQRSGSFGGSFLNGAAYVLRPEIGAHVTGEGGGVILVLGYDLPITRGRPILASEFNPAQADPGEDGIRAGHAGPVMSLRVHV